MRTSWLVMVLAIPGLAADLSPEAQIALTSLRAGERDRVQAVLGEATELPLYRGDFTVDPKARTVIGRVAITVPAKRASKDLFFRSTPGANHSGAVVLTKARVNGVAVALAQPDPSLYRVSLPEAPDGPVTVELLLNAMVPKQPRNTNAAMSLDGPVGDYGAFMAGDDVVSLVGLIPMLPPERNGQLFEGPSGLGDLGSFDPSNFVVSVTVPTPWRVVANGQAVGEVPTGNGTVRFAYAVGAAREMPLLVMKQPQVSSKKFGDVEVEAVLLGRDKKRGDKVVQTAGEFLQLFEKKLGPYPFKTLRVVEQPLNSGAGGMEFPGLVTVSSSLVSGESDPLEALGLGGDQGHMLRTLLGPALTKLVAQTLDFTIAHELAHQYSAMLVGSDPIAEPIADEPLTQHLALLALEWRSGKKAANEMRDGQLKGAFQLHRMMGGQDGKAERATHEYESNREYAALMYGKAPLLFDELRKLLGNDAWERTLKRYVEENRYRWVTARTLTDLAADESRQPRKVAAMRAHWWEQAHGDEDLPVDLAGAMDSDVLKGMDADLLKQMDDLMKSLGGP